jgi:hypothetical protein
MPFMSELGFHRIEDDIAESWLEDWAGAGLAEIEEFLAKHADFLRYLASHRVSTDGEAVDAREVPGEATQPAAE